MLIWAVFCVCGWNTPVKSSETLKTRMNKQFRKRFERTGTRTDSWSRSRLADNRQRPLSKPRPSFWLGKFKRLQESVKSRNEGKLKSTSWFNASSRSESHKTLQFQKRSEIGNVCKKRQTVLSKFHWRCVCVWVSVYLKIVKQTKVE